MIKYFSLIPLCFALTACGTTSTWEKAGVTAQQEQMDLKECEFEAKKHNGAETLGALSAQLRFYELRDLCLQSKGYVKTSSQPNLY